VYRPDRTAASSAAATSTAAELTVVESLHGVEDVVTPFF
jgi:hypothetical protein